MIFRADDVSIQ